ncbi:SH3 domain-containing protein [Pannonibacter phragmitetus]|uniref:SH3 domain-containing protein n=1 Tax=Pannonibacter phragmitetus TaxID=121719 RepID=UPI003D2F3F98
MSDMLDRRRHPVRPDLAARTYEGRVSPRRFADGERFRIAADVVALRKEPRPDCGLDTQALHGETVMVYETTAEGWAWGQLDSDGYVGWLPSDALAPVEEVTHVVRALRTFRYPGADLRLPALGHLSLGAKVRVVGQVETRGLVYAVLSDGSAVVSGHLVPVGSAEPDWVTIAESLLGTPYLWG